MGNIIPTRASTSLNVYKIDDNLKPTRYTDDEPLVFLIEY